MVKVILMIMLKYKWMKKDKNNKITLSHSNNNMNKLIHKKCLNINKINNNKIIDNNKMMLFWSLFHSVK